jgi:hypothetical protein
MIDDQATRWFGFLCVQVVAFFLSKSGAPGIWKSEKGEGEKNFKTPTLHSKKSTFFRSVQILYVPFCLKSYNLTLKWSVFQIFPKQGHNDHTESDSRLQI